MSTLNRIANLFRQRRLDDEFDEEMRCHIEMRIDRNVARGMSRADAEVEARRHFGSTVRAKEGMREARLMMWIETLGRDLAYGSRMFLRQRWTTLLAVVTLSLGIGANTVIFSLLHAAWLQPLPFPDPDRLVAVVDNYRTVGTVNVPPTVPELVDVRAATRMLDAVSFFDARDAQINGGTEPARAISARIEAQFFTALGVQPALGRLFNAADHEEGREPVVMLSDGFWRRSFGADPAVIDRRIIINGSPHTVVGVLPQGVSFDYFTAEPIELYVPFPMIPLYTQRTGEFANVRRVTAIARLKQGATLEQADAEVRTISERIGRDHAPLYRRGSDGQDLGFVMGVTPLRQLVAGGSLPVTLMLFGAVGVILLIACVNTAQFLLARAVERRPEVVIRTALGAGRGRLLRQFLTEAFLLAALATSLGLLQAWALVDLLRGALASPSPLVEYVRIHPPVFLFTIAVTGIVTLACGLLPAMHAVRGRVVTDPQRLTGTTRARSRHLMISVQVALSMVLLVSAGLFAAALLQLQNRPRGYDAEDVTVMRMRVAGQIGQGRTGTTYQEYLRRVSAVPGVVRAAVADAPLPEFAGMPFTIVGGADDAGTLTRQRASWRIVSEGYFEVLGIPIFAGRNFADTDALNSPPVAIINDHMARTFWPNQNPIGRQLRSGEGPRARVATIIGVVGNVRPPQQLEAAPQIYVSYLQQSEPSVTLMFRSAAGTAAPVDLVKRAVWTALSAQPLFDIQPLTSVIERRMAEPRVMTWVLGTFATLAVLMSTLGVYTIVSYLTARRTKEVALRRAIGATSEDVLRLLGMPTMRWTVLGVAAGLVAAIAATRVLSSIAPIVDLPSDSIRTQPSLLLLISAGYVVVVAAAVLAPAARALRIQPATILRSE